MSPHRAPALFRLRAANDGDMAGVAGIYAHHVRTGYGSFEDLDAANLADVEKFFRDYYGPNNVSNCVPNNCTPANLAAGNTVFEVQELQSEVLFDLEAQYAFSDDLTLAVGARNVFDEYPDEGEFRLRETSNGRIYRSDSIVDWQGGFYYGKIKYAF